MISIFLTVLLATTAVRAESGVGNGGFVIQCGNKIQLFDYYQAESSGLRIQPPSGNNLKEKVESLLERLSKIDPNRAKNYRWQYKSWRGWYHDKTLNIDGLRLNAEQVADPELQKKFGLGSIQIPADCKLILAIQQKKPINDSGQGSSLMSTETFLPVWKLLDTDTQAGLIAHELFYNELIIRTKNMVDAVPVRNLNGLLGSFEFSSLSKSTWIEHLIENRLTAMFPDFESSNNENVLDLSHDPQMAHAKDYVIINRSRTPATFNGPVQICDQTYIAKAESGSFINGLVPMYSSVFNSVVDLSCFSNTEIKLNIDSYAPVEFTGHGETPRIASLMTLGSLALKHSGTYLQTYSNPNLKFIGPVRAMVKRTSFDGDMAITLNPTEFSDVQVLVDGQWKRIQRSCSFNLTNGNLINFE